jgi:hypothetical protein
VREAQPVILPRATRRYRHRNRHTGIDSRDARHALAVTHGSGYVIVGRRGKPGTKKAAKIAKAWNEMISLAEDRHIQFWARFDREHG